MIRSTIIRHFDAVEFHKILNQRLEDIQSMGFSLIDTRYTTVLTPTEEGAKLIDTALIIYDDGCVSPNLDPDRKEEDYK